MSVNLLNFPTEEEFNKASTDFITNFCAQAQAPTSAATSPDPNQSPRIHYSLTPKIALSGGSTPGPIYKALSQRTDIDLSQIEFFQVDERYIPAGHKDSNRSMIRETLHPKNFHFFDTSLPIEESLNQYEKILRTYFAPPGSHLLTILGIGPDGHTASLFPNSPALTETRSVAHTTTTEFAITNRLTLTFPAILQSKSLLVLIKGKSKQEILNKVLHSKSTIQECPAKKLLEHPNLTIHFGDF